MIRFFSLMLVLWCFPGYVADIDISQAAKYSLNQQDSNFDEDTNKLIYANKLQELELLMSRSALYINKRKLLKNLVTLINTTDTLQKLLISLPPEVCIEGRPIDEAAILLFEALTDNKTVKILDIRPCFAWVGLENARILAKLVSENVVLQELSMGLMDWKSHDFTELGLALAKNTTLTRLSLSIDSISEDDAKKLVNAIRENKMLTHVKLVCSGGNAITEIAKIRAIFKEADRD